MTATAIKNPRMPERIKTSLKENYAGSITVVANNPLPRAGSGACTHCSCQQFVKDDAMYKPYSPSANQPNPCKCGHDYRMHS